MNDDEIDRLFLRECDERGVILYGHARDAFGDFRHAGVARHGIELRLPRRLRELPRKRMLASARSDQKYLHVHRPFLPASAAPGFIAQGGKCKQMVVNF